MTDTQALTQNEIHQDLEDFQVFESHQRLNKKEMFENQFLDFMKWFKDDVHSNYTRKDFQRMELKHLLYRVGGLVFVLLPLYLYFHSQFPQYALVWGGLFYSLPFSLPSKGKLCTCGPIALTNLLGLTG